MNDKKLKYELTPGAVEVLLKVLDKTQVSGIQNAQSLLQLVEILKSPLNAEELEKEQFEALKSKFDKEEDTKKKK